MRDIDNSFAESEYDNHISFIEIFQILMSGKWIIISFTSFFSIAGVIYSLSLPNIFESRALLVASSPSKQSSLMQNYGSIASLAGIDIPEGSESNALQAQEKLNTLSFFENNFLPNIFLPDLMAFESWDPNTNNPVYNEKIYDNVNKRWVRKATFPQQSTPSAQESFNVFRMNHLSIYADKKTKFVTVKIKHQSPYIAQEWTKLLIDQLNNYYRIRDKNKAEKASNYLNNLLAKTNLSEIKQAIASLLQQETQKLTLIEANEFYVYEYIDPPAVMERKSEPIRSIICITFAIMGGMLSLIFVLVKHYVFNRELKT